jgi:ActR/RegA family two-component response regulator
MSESILIVDDEEPVRRTFQEWLAGSGLDVRLLVAADAESALKHANRETIDLAVLDWNLGSGSDGLQLLEDLALFHPEVVAILVTGFAHQATPLDALRMGVRDYLDKNQDLNRETFLRAVLKQLDRIVPAKRQRAFNQSLKEFREAVEKILPLVRTTSALNDPVPLPQAVGSLFRFLLRTTGAVDGVLLVRHVAGDTDTMRSYSAEGMPLEVELVPFARSLAATAVSLQEPSVMNRLREEAPASVQLQPFERKHNSVLAAPISVGPGWQAVMELFGKEFTDADKRLASAASEFGGELLRQALVERQNHQLLLDAVGAALGATEKLAATSARLPAAERLEQPPPEAVMDRLRQGLETSLGPAVDPDAALQLAEAIRVLALRHGPGAVRHCIEVIRSLRDMLDDVAGAG